MTKQINMNVGASVQGGPGLGLMTSTGNPWTVVDGLADELVNRKLATYVTGAPAPSQYGTPLWADQAGTQVIKPDGTTASLGSGGVTNWSALTDKTTADIVGTNLGLAAALGAKADSDQPVFTGAVTVDGVTVTAAYAMPDFVINTAKDLNTKTIAADSTFTFSVTPAADTWFALSLKNSDAAAAHTIAIPSCFSIAQQVPVTALTIPASGELLLQWRYDGTAYKLWGEMVPGDLAEVALALAATVDLGAAPSYNVTIAPGGTGITSFGTAPAGTYRVARALGVITVTNSSVIGCPGAVDMVLAAGDIFAARSDGAGNWRILWLSPAAGRPSLTGVNNWALSQTCDLSAPVYAATITLDCKTHANHINIGTLTGNLTLANPTGYTKAVTLNVWLTQDATGSRLLTLGSKFKTAGGAGITLSTAANAVDLLTLTYNPTKDIWFAAIAKGVGVAPLQPLRFASNSNYASSAFTTTSGIRLNQISRIAFWVGSGDMLELVLSFHNWIMAATSVTLGGNAYSIVKCALERDGGITVPVTFSGSRTKTIAAGDTDIQSDPILPSAFSLTKFTRGEKYWIRLQISVTTAGHQHPCGIPYQGSRGGSFPSWVGWAFDPVENPTVSDVDSTGTISLGNSVGTGVGKPYTPIVLGRFVSGDPATWIGIGDSIMDAANDTLNGVGSAGFFARALMNDTFNGSWVAGMDFGSSGAVTNLWTGANVAKATQYWQYGKYAVEEFGTNSFPGGNGALSSLQTQSQTLWTMLYSNGIQGIIKTKILPRCTSTDSWATLGNQTAASVAYAATGEAGLYNDWCDTQIATGKLSAVVPMNSVRDSGNAWRWLSNGSANYMTNDGIHPVAAGHALMATELRTAMASFT